MEEKVILYDFNNVKIGETYVRRARQLVKQQRAFWVDDSQRALRFAPGAERFAEEERPEAAHAGGAPDEDLMKLARRNVILKNVFKLNLLIWLTVSGFLVLMWLWIGARYFWPIWVIAPWGFAVGIIGIVFKSVTSFGSGFNNKIAEEYHRLKRH
ncbi:MAG: 2TM domain-containing protein [Defluviitaleaceae bacterium]|nr:2TM domain-containing protein [Defluviitaleaceae bacterium]